MSEKYPTPHKNSPDTQPANSQGVIKEVPGSSDQEAKVIEFPVPQESAAINSMPADLDKDSGKVMQLRKPIIDRVPTAAELKANKE